MTILHLLHANTNFVEVAKTNKQNKNSLFRNTGYIETGYIKLRNPSHIMQQLVKTIHFIKNGKFYKVEL